MKTLYKLIVVTVFITFTSCQNKASKSYKKATAANTERIEFAKNLSNKILTSQKNGAFYPLSEEEAEPIMVNSLNEHVQKEAYKRIKSLFGDYKDLKFESFVEFDKAQKYEIYRFKGTFETSSNVEIRTVLNSKGKLAGFFVKPWSETL